MEQTIVQRKFGEIGARVKFVPFNRFTAVVKGQHASRVDIRNDKEGEHFQIEVAGQPEVQVLQIAKDDKHLLLQIKGVTLQRTVKGDKLLPFTQKLLCGHDEKHWFVAGIPQGIPVSTVTQAKQALKPNEILREERGNIRFKESHKRHRKLKDGRKIHRQGEFMFVPEPDFQPPKGNLTKIWHNEPMSRGGKPHMAENLYRYGGTSVYVGPGHRNGLTEDEYKRIVEPKDRRHFQLRVRDPIVHVNGKIRHPDHKVLDLGNIWHLVALNTENKAQFFAQTVAFLD